MNIKIDSTGVLNIERAGTWKPMKCVKDQSNLCSDSCPLFEDPFLVDAEWKTYTVLSPIKMKEYYKLQICENVFESSDKFLDERIKSEA